MSSFSLLGLVNLVGIVCAALAFLLYLRHAARRLEAKEAKTKENGPPPAPAETAAPGYTLMLLFSENSGLRIGSVRIPDLYNNNIQIGNLNFV